MGWVKVTERLPALAGWYRVKRRGIGRRPAFEDECHFTPACSAGGAYWSSRRGVIIVTIVEWYEEKEEA